MKVLILYRPKSEHATTVESFIRDFQNKHGGDRLDVVDADSRDGLATATLYDIMSYPAILALRNDGSVIKSWVGEALPLMDELAYYTFSVE